MRGQCLEPLKMKKAPVDVVCARFGNHVDNAAGRAAKLRARSGRDDLKFLDGVERDVDGGPLPAGLLAEEPVIVVASVQTDVVEDTALSGEVDLVTVRPLSYAHARRQSEQILEFPAEHRKVTDR